MKRLPPTSITMRAPTDIAQVNGAGDLDHQSAHTDNSAINIDGVDVADLFRERLHCANLWVSRFPRVRLTPCLPASLIIAPLFSRLRALPVRRRVSRRSTSEFAPNAELERERIRKVASRNMLVRSDKNCTERPCGPESDFVNHVASGSESVVQRRFESAAKVRPT